jgi:hypothetical protein
MEMVKAFAGQNHVDVLPSVCGASAGKNDTLLVYEVRKMGGEVSPGSHLLQKGLELCRLSLRGCYPARPKLHRSRLGRYEPHAPRKKR